MNKLFNYHFHSTGDGTCRSGYRILHFVVGGLRTPQEYHVASLLASGQSKDFNISTEEIISMIEPACTSE